MNGPSLEYSTLKRLAAQEGIDILAVGDIGPVSEDKKFLSAWQEQGFAGEMKYMNRPAEDLSDPLKLLPQARSLIICTVNYQGSPHPFRAAGFGRVARYAWGMDYHKILPLRLNRLIERIKGECGIDPLFKIFSDAVPLLERAFARRAGVGFIGRNTMLIKPGQGSFFFIGEILSDLEVNGVSHAGIKGSCGSCQRCAPACPTGAIVSDYRLDARRCISYLTIEKRGSFSIWEREAIGEWVFGCDICQDVCPFNHAAKAKNSPATFDEFSEKYGVGPLLDLGSIFEIESNRQFEERFRDTPLTRPGRAGLIRNALCVAANTAAEGLTGKIEHLSRNDPSPVIRRHAVWALCKISRACNSLSQDRLNIILNTASSDRDDAVREEARELSELGYV